jgi:DNA-binding GntR family transcriptional regulator
VVRGGQVPRRNETYDQLLLDIICREHPPGAILDEAALARRYRTGLASIREALFRLSLERLVHRWPRIGTRVADLSVFELQHIFEARLAVEVSCAELAAQMATVAELQLVRDSLESWQEAIEARDFRTLIRLDQQFHRRLAEASHNQVLIPIVSMLHNSAQRFWYFTLPRSSVEHALEGMRRHVRVLEAVESRDSGGARRAMRELLGHFNEAKGIVGATFPSEAS